MKKHSTFRSSLTALAAVAALVCGHAFAQGTPQDNVPGHPRVNEVNKRIDNQQTRIDKGVANGTITSTQAARDETRDANIAQRTSADEARHNGHLTRRETARLNRSENRNGRHIRHQRKH